MGMFVVLRIVLSVFLIVTFTTGYHHAGKVWCDTIYASTTWCKLFVRIVYMYVYGYYVMGCLLAVVYVLRLLSVNTKT
jgi:hypothetical protein